MAAMLEKNQKQLYIPCLRIDIPILPLNSTALHKENKPRLHQASICQSIYGKCGAQRSMLYDTMVVKLVKSRL